MTNTNTPKGTGRAFRIFCKECGALLSTLLQEATSLTKFRNDSNAPAIPHDVFAFARDVVVRGKPFFDASAGVVLDIGCLPLALRGGNRHGCCGPTGEYGFNLFCENEHPVGTEFGDCWMPHYVDLSVDLVEVRRA